MRSPGRDNRQGFFSQKILFGKKKGARSFLRLKKREQISFSEENKGHELFSVDRTEMLLCRIMFLIKLRNFDTNCWVELVACVFRSLKDTKVISDG